MYKVTSKNQIRSHVLCVSFNFILSVFTESGLTKENGKCQTKLRLCEQNNKEGKHAILSILTKFFQKFSRY